MRAHVLQHVPYEGIGNIDAWLSARQASVSYTQLFADPSLPSTDDFDLLIVMGGPMSVNDEEQLPWLRPEKRVVAQAVAQGKPVLGICLGAQLIASGLGARVYPAPHKEIGWFPVRAEKATSDVFTFPAEILAFHWHGETFDLPPGAAHLARSDAVANQAFQIGGRAIGLQFHLETTAESADAIITHSDAHLFKGPYVQNEAELRAAPSLNYAAVNELMIDVLEYLTR